MEKKETVLKREFRSRDLQRMRNLINKNSTAATGSQVGYTKAQEYHKEGDTWIELDKTWTIKNGIKINITKLNKAKNIGLVPMLCPKCSHPISHDADKKIYRLFNICLDCRIEFETQLKIDGKFEEYERQEMKKNVDSFIKTTEQNLDSYLDELNSDHMVSETGEVDEWEGNNIYLETLKNKIAGELNQIKEKFM